MNKESFILYNSFYEPIKVLKNEQLGKLFRAIFNYTINGEITQDNEILVAFMFIKNQLDLDTKKWEESKQQRSEAGKKGMEKRWGKQDNDVINDITNDNTVINDITKITVNDNVNVNDNDNVNVEKDNNKLLSKKKFIKPTLDEIKEYCIKRNNTINAEHFFNYYESNGWKVGRNSMKDWKACIRTWESKDKKVNKTSNPFLNLMMEEQYGRQ